MSRIAPIPVNVSAELRELWGQYQVAVNEAASQGAQFLSFLARSVKAGMELNVAEKKFNDSMARVALVMGEQLADDKGMGLLEGYDPERNVLIFRR